MFDDGFGTEEGIGLAALAALIGGGVQGARKVPVYGIETIASLLGKEGRDVVRASRQLGGLVDSPTTKETLAQNDVLMNLGLGKRPRAADLSTYTKDTTYAGRRKPIAAQFMGITPDGYDIVVLPDGSMIKVTDARTQLTEPTKVTRKKGTKSVSATLRRLERSGKGPARMKAGNIETAEDLNIDAVRAQVLDDLAESFGKNRQMSARVEAARARRALGSQRKFIKESRKSSRVREEVSDALNKEADVFAKQFGIDPADARRRMAVAFSALSPKATLETNWDRLTKVLATAEADSFGGGVSIPQLDAWVRTPAGQAWYENVYNQMLNRAASALQGGGAGSSELLFRGEEGITKTGLLADVLQGKTDSAILDTAELNRVLGLGSADADLITNARAAMYESPDMYRLAVQAVNEALQEGQIGKTAWALRPRRTGLAGLQSALQRRGYEGVG